MQSRKMRLAILAVFLLLSTLECHQLYAELSPPPPLKGFGWRQALPVQLLRDEAVQKDLGLTSEDIQEVNDTNSQINWNQALTPEQKNRLHQIHLQKEKLVNVVSDTAVIKELGGFTEKQQQAVFAAHAHFDRIQQSLPNKLRWNGVRYKEDEFRKVLAERMQYYEKELTTTLMNVLTPEQLKKFEELKGKPLEKPMPDGRTEK